MRNYQDYLNPPWAGTKNSWHFIGKAIVSNILILCAYLGGNALAVSLSAYSTKSPQDTLKTFMTAMEEYRHGKETHKEGQITQIDKAINCLDLERIPFLLRADSGRETVIFLKEIIDRIMIIDYTQIPDSTTNLEEWSIPGTEITLIKIKEGERAGEWLFSPDTVENAREMFNHVKPLSFIGNNKGAVYQEPYRDLIIPAWADNQLIGLKLWQWLAMLILIFAGLFLKWTIEIFGKILVKKQLLNPTKFSHQLIEKVIQPLSLIAASCLWCISVYALRIEGTFKTLLLVVLQIILSYAFIKIAYLATVVFADFLTHKARDTEFPIDDQLTPLLAKSLKLFVVIIGCLIAIQNLGVNVMSLVAGLGLGGLAFALAAKDTAANLIGSIMILMDKVFKVGDWIKIGDTEGIIEEIGFRSTRLRTFHNSILAIPNSEIANSKIDNMGQRLYRRVRTILGITYDTPPEKLEAFLEGIKNIIKANPTTRKDFYQVAFDSYGDFSLNILVYYFLDVPDWPAELTEKQNIYLEILRLAKALGVSFAFPSRTLYVDTFPGQPSLMPQHHINIADLKNTAYAFGPNGTQTKPRGLSIFTPQWQEPQQPTSS